MKVKWVVTVLAAALVAATVNAQARGTAPDRDEILSPYFSIEDGDASIDSLPLKETRVEVSIIGVIAHVTVHQTYANDGERPINAKYVFPASTRAAVHGMQMMIGNDVIKAKIKEREQAKQEFEQAKEEGKSASLLEQQRPNVFTMDVANVMPGDVIKIELQYSELITPTDGIYAFVYPTVVGPRYSTFTAATATNHNKWVKNPYLHEGEMPTSPFNIEVKISTGIPLSQLACKTHQTDIMWDGTSAAEVALLQDEQASAGNRDFILEYALMGQQVDSGLLLYEGTDENFFLLMAQPPKTVAPQTIPPRDYIFVMDVSGSMNGFPISVSKKLLQELIGGLKPTDTFNVILFAGASSSMAETSLPATKENIRMALHVIDSQQGGGGTELAAGLRHAIRMPQEENISRSIVVITDGYISAEKEAFSLIRDNLNRANVFAFGIGSSVNRYLIEGIARAGKGEPFIVTDKDEAATTATKLREYIESPVLTGISLHYDGFETYAVEPTAIPDLMAKRPLQIIGKWKGTKNGSITIKGANGDGLYEQSFNVADAKSLPEHRCLRYLWARTRVADLGDFGRIRSNGEIIKEITALGLTYDLLTEYTSFIAVYEKIRKESGSSTDVTQPLPLPQGVSDLAVGGEHPAYASKVGFSGSASSVPEPGLTLLIAIAAMILLVSLLRTVLQNRYRRAN